MTERENWGRRERWSAGATNEMSIMQKTGGSLNKLIETVNRFIKQLALGVQVGGRIGCSVDTAHELGISRAAQVH